MEKVICLVEVLGEMRYTILILLSKGGTYVKDAAYSLIGLHPLGLWGYQFSLEFIILQSTK